jgi:hypothetical protein
MPMNQQAASVYETQLYKDLQRDLEASSQPFNEDATRQARTRAILEALEREGRVTIDLERQGRAVLALHRDHVKFIK